MKLGDSITEQDGDSDILFKLKNLAFRIMNDTILELNNHFLNGCFKVHD